MSFDLVSLDDIADVIDSLHKTPKYADKGWAMVRGTDVRYGYLELEKTFKVDEGIYEEFSRRYRPKKDDIIITRVGSYGLTALVNDDAFCLGQNISAIRPKINAKYLYLCLNSNFVRHQIESKVVGTTQKTLSLKAINSLLIPRFGDVQEECIANIGWSLNEKIHNNGKINQTLEKMAQALFKSWFVDFEPVKAKIAVLAAGGSQEEATLAAMTAISGKNADALVVFEREHPEQYAELKATAELFPSAMQESALGDIPEGWMVNPTSAHYNISIGKTPPRKEAQWFSTTDGDLKWVSIKDMGIASTYISETSERLTHEAVKKFNIKVMPADTVFLSFKLTVGRVCITTEDMCSNEAIAHFTPKENKYKSYWLYHALHSFDFNKLGSTSSIATAVNSKTIRDMKLIFPNELISQRYTEKVSSLMQLQKLNAGQINSLTLLRDTLLPKLLSGEITLPEAEQAVSEAENV